MIILDTNVVSELMRPQPAPQVHAHRRGLRSCDAALATRNLPDFADTGIEVIDPWAAAGA